MPAFKKSNVIFNIEYHEVRFYDGDYNLANVTFGYSKKGLLLSVKNKGEAPSVKGFNIGDFDEEHFQALLVEQKDKTGMTDEEIGLFCECAQAIVNELNLKVNYNKIRASQVVIKGPGMYKINIPTC